MSEDIKTNLLQSYTDQERIQGRPSNACVKDLLTQIDQILFPGYRNPLPKKDLGEFLDLALPELEVSLISEFQKAGIATKSASQKAVFFLSQLSSIRSELLEDLEAITAGDPAANSSEEVILSYPGFYAIMVYRIAHRLHLEQVPLIPRMMTEISHNRTGVDIHPAAKIGSHFCIDHGTGIVIGETSVIGNNVKLYQGVTIGALSVKKTEQTAKRHPTIEDHVTVYARTTILGGETVIGAHSIIGGNVWITESVPKQSVLYVAPDHIQTLKSRKKI